ncbi:MAG: hemolysin family protein [Pirellulales bacterium]|nr:hemolysin family protein [Pirellulales bacterium]
MTSLFGEFSIIIILILANGLFAAAEIAIINARKGRLQQLAENGDRGARIALDLAANPNVFLPTVQVGITLLNMFAAAYGGVTLANQLADWLRSNQIDWVTRNAPAIALNLVTLFIAALSLILGELVPKRLALRQAETLARYVAPLMQLISVAARPLIQLMGLVTEGILWLLGVREQNEPSVSIDDIEHLIGTGTAEGVVEPVEQRVALEALRLGERKVRDVMRPRIDLDAMAVDTPPDEILGTVIMAGFSRLPVYENDLDHILGFVHIKDIFRQQYLGWPLDLGKMLRPALFVPESMPLDRLLQLFQEQHNQLAIVLDEYGGTEGMVTLEDVVQELVGEIRDEQQRDQAQRLVQRDENSWLVDGQVHIEDLCEALGIKWDASEERDYNTVSGLILSELGQIPQVGERAQWQGFSLEVVDMDGQRIDRVLVTRGG